MYRKDLQALTFVGPPMDNPELDPIAVLHVTHSHLKILIFWYSSSHNNTKLSQMCLKVEILKSAEGIVGCLKTFIDQ